MAASRARRLAAWVRGTPLHPQWLLGRRNAHESAIRGISSGQVLDVGCADRWAQAALQPGVGYLCLDYPATGGVMYAARPDVFGDASRLPVRSSSVDAVLMLEVLEHLREPREALVEAARVLRPGGRLLLSIPFLYPIHDAPHDYQRFTLHGLQREVEAVGLHVTRCEPSLGSAHSAGLLAALAMAGMAEEALRRRSVSVVLVPLVALLIPAVNVFAWMVGRLLPDWAALTAGYALEAVRP